MDAQNLTSTQEFNLSRKIVITLSTRISQQFRQFQSIHITYIGDHNKVL
jgi:hypothetical protein